MTENENIFTEEFIREQRELLEKIDPLPWGAQGVGFGTRILSGPPKHVILADMKNRRHRENAEYIKAAANHYPAALEQIEQLQKEAQEISAVLDRLAGITSQVGDLFFTDDFKDDWTAALDWIEKHLSFTPEESYRERQREIIHNWRLWVNELRHKANIQEAIIDALRAGLADMLSLIEEHGDNLTRAHAHRILKARQALNLRAEGKEVARLCGWIVTKERMPSEIQTVNAVYHEETVVAYWQEQAEGEPETGFRKYYQWYYMQEGDDSFIPMQDGDGAPEFPEYWQPLPLPPASNQNNPESQ